MFSLLKRLCLAQEYDGRVDGESPTGSGDLVKLETVRAAVRAVVGSSDAAHFTTAELKELRTASLYAPELLRLARHDVLIECGLPDKLIKLLAPFHEGCDRRLLDILRVDQELWALQELENESVTLLPSQMDEGRVQGWSTSGACLLLGCRVLVTRLHEPTLMPWSISRCPQLTFAEQRAFAEDMVAAILLLQDHNLAHNDLSPVNVAPITGQGTELRRFQLVNLGCCTPLYDASSCPVHNLNLSLKLDSAAMESGPPETIATDPWNSGENGCLCCTCETKPPVAHAWRAADAVFNPIRYFMDRPPDRLTDLLSLAFSIIKVSGAQLPWEEALRLGDVRTAMVEQIELQQAAPKHPCLRFLIGEST
ncbi:hypothetical protein WJX73_010255 [Symbiochloris irregularis]|uniref:Protein kinase domain-containing protein n=1 Tax=Symbiochloris irregularis TaxID=706552 RepID=A0AAW1PBN0_9CHLO